MIAAEKSTLRVSQNCGRRRPCFTKPEGQQVPTDCITSAKLTADEESVTGEKKLLRDQRKRIRDVRQGPDGNLYVLTDAPNGEIWRITPG